MSLTRAPRVGFGLQIEPKWRARVDLARMMTRQLSKRFGYVRLYPGYLFRNSVLVVTFNGDKFHVVVRENKYPGNAVRMWDIMINPARFPITSERFPEDEQERYAKDLLVISNEIHAVLNRTPGITRLRWWFLGWETNKPGVRTPAELPWHIDTPELGADVKTQNMP